MKVVQGGEVAAENDLSREGRESHLDLIEPRGMLGREVKDDAVAGVAQELLAGGHRLEDTALAFDPEVAGETDGLGHQAHHRFLGPRPYPPRCRA